MSSSDDEGEQASKPPRKMKRVAKIRCSPSPEREGEYIVVSSSDDEEGELIRAPRKKKRLSKKKKRTVARKQNKRQRGEKKKNELAKWQAAAHRVLDSFYLRRSSNGPRETGLSTKEAVKRLQHEFNFFGAMSKPQCDFLREQFRAALLLVLAGKEESVEILSIPHGHVLRDRWLACVRLEQARLQRSKKKPAQPPSDRNDNRPPATSEHPEGARRSRASSSSAAQQGPHADDSDCSSTEVESFSDDDVDREEGDEHQVPAQGLGYKPLELNSETRLQVRLLRKIRKPADITDRTAQWISDKFMFSSQYILDMLQGDTPWPGWSRAQLFNACNKISALYEQVELRERAAKSLSESTRKEMLKSECKGLREIRLMLNIARLGPGGGDEYRQLVLTEKARSDFETSFADPKAFKLYRRSLKQVRDTPKKGRSGSSSSRSRPPSYNRSRGSAFRPYRTSRNPPQPRYRNVTNRRPNDSRRATGNRRPKKQTKATKRSGPGRGGNSR